MPEGPLSEERHWEVHCGDPGNSITDSYWTFTEVLECCGRMLYANVLFDVLFLRIREMNTDTPENLQGAYPFDPNKKPQWIMKSISGSGDFSCRQLASTHELFGMLIAGVRLGAKLIEVYHISNATSDAHEQPPATSETG